MTEKEKAEMMNLRRRVEAQREEIKALRRTIAEMKETGTDCHGLRPRNDRSGERSERWADRRLI